MNVLLTVILFVDFVYRLVTAPSGRATSSGSSAGPTSGQPAVPQLKILRVFRLVRVVRLLRENGIRVIGNRLMRNRAGSALLTLLLMGILVLEFGSLWMLALEQDAPDANITTASDALWYVIVTISTVGYGDQYPVTPGAASSARSSSSSASASSARSPATWPTSSSRRSRPKEEVEVLETRERVAHLRELMAQQQATLDQLDKLLSRRAARAGGLGAGLGRRRCRPGAGDPAALECARCSRCAASRC